MAQTKKYKAYGILRKNNLSDIQDKEASLNNLLNNLPGVDEEAGITFISQDLDAIRGLKGTDIGPTDFSQLAGSTPFTIRVDGEGEPILDEAGEIVSVPVNPLIRLQDRFQIYRSVTEDPPVFSSGKGPRAYFVPSTMLPTSFPKGSNIDTQLEPNLADPSVQVSDDFWVLGEFLLNDRIRVDFQDEYGGIMWEGYYIPNPSTTIHTFFYETSGLFHVEYDRFGDGNWQVLKSIYAKKRNVLVQTAGTNITTIVLQAGETAYVSVGDFLDSDNEAIITDVTSNSIVLSKAITVTVGQTLTFDMPIGDSITTGRYTINEILDRGETPQMKKRIFWWFPNSGDYTPDYKYLRNTIAGRQTYDYFFLNIDQASPTPSAGSVRELLDNAITPSQDVLDNQFKSTKPTTSAYTPKALLSQITKGSTNISFDAGTRSITGTFTTTEIGNYVVPTAVADLGPVIPKNTRLKDILGSNVTANSRLVNVTWGVDRTNYAVNLIDHNGLVDYFVVSSSGNVATIQSSTGTTAKIKKDMYLVYNNVNQFVRITEIIPPTSFRTSSNLALTNAYVYVYANSGFIDKSLDVFCVGVFGQVLAEQATIPIAGQPQKITLQSTAGVANGMVAQFGNSISSETSVVDVEGNVVTLSANLLATINQYETIVFAPSGTTVNKDICVLPLNLSPPFDGVPTGLDTNEKGIRSSQPSLNVKFDALNIQAPVTTVGVSETYDGRIDLANTTLSIITKKIV